MFCRNIIVGFQRSVEIVRIQINFLFYYVPYILHFLSMGNLLNNANVSSLGVSKNPTTALYSETAKPEIVFIETKTIKMAKSGHTCKNYAHTYNIEILNSFNLELKLQNTESVFKNRLRTLLNELRGFKFVIACW